DRISQTPSYSRARLLAGAGLMALLCVLFAALDPPRPARPADERPSFVVIQTDDPPLDGLYPAYTAYAAPPQTRPQPNTLALHAKKGGTSTRYYGSYPLCCPSRVSLMTGRHAHNTGVKGNVQPNGGYYGFSFRGAYTHNIATWLQGAGYRTIHVGKFLNGYG